MERSQEQIQQQKGLAIIFCLFLLYMWKETVYDQYFEAQTAKPAAVQTAPVAPKAETQSFEEPAAPVEGATEVKPGAVTKPSSYPSDKQLEQAGVLSLNTETFNAKLSLLGGRLTELYLTQFKAEATKDSAPLNMIQHVEQAPLPLGVYSGGINDALVQYSLVDTSGVAQPLPATVSLLGQDRREFVLKGNLSDGREVTKTVTFFGRGYFIDTKVSLSAAPADGSRAAIEWTQVIAKDSPSILDPYSISGFVWWDAQKAHRESFSKLTADVNDIPTANWIAVSDKYFMAALVPPEGSPAKTMKTGELYRARVSGSEIAAETRLFVGPKSYRLLKEVGSELYRVIDFGMTGIIAAPLLSMLHALYDIFGNYGLAIIMLTIIVKSLLYPLNASAFKQMKAMQDLAPELKKMKETITDKQQQQLEMMALYKKKGVNPLGGCLPILLQMPIFIGLYSALLLAIELRHAPFALWIQDLSSNERLMIGGIGIPVMVILFVASMLVQQMTTPSNMDPAQKRVMYIMPLVFGFMFASMPAGLTLYWLTNNVISIGQQMAMRRDSGKKALAITGGISIAVFVLGFLLTRLG